MVSIKVRLRPSRSPTRPKKPPPKAQPTKNAASINGLRHSHRSGAMITLLGSPRRCCDGLTRRETLKAGALSVLGGSFNLPSLLRAEETRHSPRRRGKAKSVIVFYLLGGAGTQDMVDMKP